MLKNNDAVETISQGIFLAVDKKITDAGFDKTLKGKITDVVSETVYEVTISGIKHTVKSTSVHRLNDIVNVIVPQNNYSEMIIIPDGITLDSTLPANGGNADTVNYHTVETNIPPNALFITASERAKLSTVETNAEVNNVSDSNATNLTDGGDTNLHFHSSDRNRNNHTGTQLASTISDFANTVKNTALTGLSVATNAIISASDTILTALGKLQKQISDNLSTLTNHINSASNPHSVTKSQIGLEDVDNKSSETIRNEITSQNIMNALGYTPLNSNLKGTANGLAELDSSGKISSTQLPSYVDDVLEGKYISSTVFNDINGNLYTPESGKIYIDINYNKTYRWSGTIYSEIGSDLALGETSSSAYRGDRGKIAYDHSQSAHAPSDAQKNSDITKSEIEAKLTGLITTHNHDSNYYTENEINNLLSDKANKAIATTEADGLMSTEDKIVIDNLNNITVGDFIAFKKSGTVSLSVNDIGYIEIFKKNVNFTGSLRLKFNISDTDSTSYVAVTINDNIINEYTVTSSINSISTDIDVNEGDNLGIRGYSISGTCNISDITICTNKNIPLLSNGKYGIDFPSLLKYDSNGDGIIDTADTAAKLSIAKTIALVGDTTGSILFDGSSDVSMTTTSRNVAFVGSDTALTSGWYKVASQTCSGYGDSNITFMITSTYANYHFGILQLQIRSENSFIDCKSLSWLTRYGFNTSNYIIHIDGMTWTLYAFQPNTQHGRLCFEILSSSNINGKNQSWILNFSDNMTIETSTPIATVISYDSGVVASANTLSTSRTIGISGGAVGTATDFNGSTNISIPITLLDATKLSGTASISTTGNAGSATKLQVPVNIAGTSFDGSSNINISYNNLTDKPTIPSGITVNDTLTSTSTTESLSANQGRVLNEKINNYLPKSGGTMSGDIIVTKIKGANNLALSNYATVQPSSNVYLYSPPNDRDAWIYLDSADSSSNWGIYHRQIDSQVGDLPGNSIGFVGGSNNDLKAYVGLGNGVVWARSAMSVNGNTVWHSGNDGSGSGLDADLLDGVDSAMYVRHIGCDNTGIMNNANWGYPYVATVSNGTYIGLSYAYWFHVQYFRHMNNDGWGLQTAYALNSNSNLMFMRYSLGTTWGGWKQITPQYGTSVPTTLAEGEVYYVYQ
jgi:hypothetical protein